jgi:WD40 repeat protein
MAGVFFSYAREDQPFVQRLFDALSAAGREPTWDQDHVAVRFSAPWRPEIKAAIENSDKFVFVVSPDSLASKPCANELAYALEINKQVIPILRRSPGEGQAAPPAVEELNWILFTDDVGFDRSLAELLSALDTDLAWAKAHTRLLVRSTEWATGGRDRSLLLRGGDLRAAEVWLAEAGGHRQTLPTTPQRDYIAASRRAANRSSRLSRGVLATGLVVALALAATAFIQRNKAIHERDQAIHEASVAASGQLAAESEALDAPDPVTASLLAAAAWQISPTAQARLSMLDALAQPERGVFPVSDSGVHSLAFSPNGTVLATGAFDGQVRLWDVADHRPIGLRLPGRTGPNYDAPSLAFSPDGKILATAGSDGTARLWDVATHRQIGTSMVASPSFGVVFAVAFSPDGKILATAGSDGTARLWDVATRQQIGASLVSGTSSTAGMQAVAFSPDGKLLASASSDGTARLWGVATHDQIGAPMRVGTAHGGGVSALAFTRDGKVLATANYEGTVRLWAVTTQQQTGVPLAASPNCDGGVFGLDFSPDGKTLATADCDGTARLWDIATYHQAGAGVAARLYFGGERSLAFSPSGTILATAGDQARLWDVTTHRQIGKPITAAGGVNGVAFSPDGKILATGSFSGKGNIPATRIFHGQFRLWDLATRQQIGGTLRAGPIAFSEQSLTVAFSPSGTILATSGDQAQLWDVTTQRQIGKPISAAGGVNGVAFSLDEKILATAGGDGTARLWNVATHRQIGPPMVTGRSLGGVFAVAFSPDGRILATGGGDGTARLWDVATHRQIGAPMVPGFGPVNSVTFSPDGKILATANGDDTARLWDTATQQQIGAPMVAGSSVGGVLAVAFSPDGKILATAGDDGTARLWNVGFPSNPLSAVCAIAARPLTPQEWNSYAQPQPFQRACP